MGISTYAQAAPSGTILTMSGQVDGDSAAAFEELLLKATRAHRPPLLLDLSRIESMDSRGLAALMTIRNLTAARDCRIRVIAVSMAVYTLLYLAGAQHILDEAPRAVPAMALRPGRRPGAGVTERARSRSAARRRRGRRSQARPAWCRACRGP